MDAIHDPLQQRIRALERQLVEFLNEQGEVIYSMPK